MAQGAGDRPNTWPYSAPQEYPCSLNMGRTQVNEGFVYSFAGGNGNGNESAWHNNTNTPNCSQWIIWSAIGQRTIKESSARSAFWSKNNTEFTTFFPWASSSSVTDYTNVQKMQAYISWKCRTQLTLDGAIGVKTLNTVQLACDNKSSINTSWQRCDGLCSYDFWKANIGNLIPAWSSEINRKYPGPSAWQADRCAQHDQKQCFMKNDGSKKVGDPVPNSNPWLSTQITYGKCPDGYEEQSDKTCKKKEWDCSKGQIKDPSSWNCKDCTEAQKTAEATKVQCTKETDPKKDCISFAQAQIKCDPKPQTWAKSCFIKKELNSSIVAPDPSAPSSTEAPSTETPSTASICPDTTATTDTTCTNGTKNPKNDKEICKNGKYVCNPAVTCCGIKLNTNVPFIGNCIEYSNDQWANTNENTTRVNIMNAFPILMGSLSRIMLTIILIGSFLMIVVWGVMMTNPEQFWDGKKIIKNVIIAIALLWLSWIILNAINPNFFR